MDEAEEYRRAIGRLPELYADGVPVVRLRGIYRTSRHNISLDNARRLWECLLPLRRVMDGEAAPSGQDAYDQILIGSALDVSQTLTRLGVSGTFGIGQKFVNLFMKDQWALGRLGEYEGLLHAPLDRIVLRQIPHRRELAPHWSAWTKVQAEGPFSATVLEYLQLQRSLKGELASRDAQSVIRLEQRLWQAGRGV